MKNPPPLPQGSYGHHGVAHNENLALISAEALSYATKDMPSKVDERFLQGRIFDTRQRLVQKLMQEYSENSNSPANNPFPSAELEDIWRDSLPPLLLPPVRKIAHFSAWRTAFLAILGLLLGLALGQAFTYVGDIALLAAQSTSSAEVQTGVQAGVQANGTSPLLSSGMSQGIGMLCGLLGAMGIVWLSEYMVSAMTLGRIRLLGKSYTWKRFSRYTTWAFAFILVLSLVRDFLAAKVGFLHLIQSFGLLITSGQVLPILSNIYGILLFIFLFNLLLRRPLSFDKDDFTEKLHMAVQQWWAGASLVAPLLQENIALKNDPTKDAWKKVGVELYSLAGELPQARGQWLEERLRRLGIEATREQGKLLWSEEMAERYTALGHIALGDACYVDEPPLMEQGLLARKGTVRKVRS